MELKTFHLHRNARKEVLSLCKSLEEEQSSIKAIFAWGWCLRKDFIPGKTGYVLLFVVSSVTNSLLEKLQAGLALLGDSAVSIAPFVLTNEELMRSLDGFPIEFVEAKFGGKAILNEELLASLQIPMEPLRLATERELRGLVFHARIVQIATLRNPAQLPMIVGGGGLKLLSLARSVCYLANLSACGTAEEVFSRLQDKLEINTGILNKIFLLPVKPETTFSREDVLALRNCLEQMTQFVDKLGG